MDPLETVSCQPWTSRLPKMAQPDLDFIGLDKNLLDTCCPLSGEFMKGQRSDVQPSATNIQANKIAASCTLVCNPVIVYYDLLDMSMFGKLSA
ncbi:unnamed protein product [Nezara viridula]|uniref:Uncharacterized protein n=1 Tax=Nezara viridula TaxID=85310 RepID=A0A9P0H660_NEZVI|nr:unnamed protein product [Nezara viridula]